MQDNGQSNYNNLNTIAAKKSNKNIIIIIAVAVAVIIALIVSLVLLLPRGEGDDIGEISLENARKDTPTLQIYAKLDKEISVGKLKETVLSISPDAEIFFEDDYTGTIQIPNTEDYILFDFFAEDWLETTDSEEADVIETIESDYEDEIEIRESDTVSNIRYVYPILESGYTISYSDEDGSYQVFDLSDFFSFPTKEEAIEAYLAPITK